MRHRPVTGAFVILMIVLASISDVASPTTSEIGRLVEFSIADLQREDLNVDSASQLQGGVQLGGELRWPAASRVGFVVNPANAPAGAAEAVASAGATWTTEADLAIDIVLDGQTDLAGAQADLVNVVSWVQTDDPGHRFVARTVTYWYADEPDVIIAFDMIFNLDHEFAVVDPEGSDAADASDAWDIETVALHEFGHALGLSHTAPDRVLRVMRPTLEAGVMQRSPAVRDVAALVELYGVEREVSTVGIFERSVTIANDRERVAYFLGPRELVPASPDAAGLFD